MNKFTFKNYPPAILAYLFCFIISLNFFIKVLWTLVYKNEEVSLGGEVLIIVASSSIVLTIMNFINKRARWGWIYKILNIYNISGTYEGVATSSFYIDDDPQKPHIQRFCKITILQNLNGFKVSGSFFTDKKLKDRVSDFESIWEEMEKSENDTYQIRYHFLNRGNLTHPDDAKYGLTTHNGITVLTYNPDTCTFKGYYFTHERKSNGELSFALIK